MWTTPKIIFNHEQLQKRLNRSHLQFSLLKSFYRSFEEELTIRFNFFKPQLNNFFLSAPSPSYSKIVPVSSNFYRPTAHLLCWNPLKSIYKPDSLLKILPYLNIQSHFYDDLENLELPYNQLECVFYPLTLQWVNDVPGVLKQIYNSLRENGIFIGCFIGNKSLKELNELMIKADLKLHQGAYQRFNPLISTKDASTLLQRAGFYMPVSDDETYTFEFSSIKHAMHGLRDSALTNIVNHQTSSLNRSILKLLDDLATDFKIIPIQLKFDIVYIIGIKCKN